MKVLLVFPSSSLSQSQIEVAHHNFMQLGLETVEYTMPEKLGYLAGSDDERCFSVISVFGRAEARMIAWCARGGYGAARILSALPPRKSNLPPRMWIGYSDNTALLLTLAGFTNQTIVHGPVAGENWGADTLHYLRAFFEAECLPQYHWGSISMQTGHDTRVLNKGKVRAPITGGNLSILASLCGTPWQPSFSGKIVLIEEVQEKPYRIDRMLTQLFQATDISKAAGFVFGTFYECNTPPGGGNIPLEDTIRQMTGHLGVPVIINFPAGHGPFQVPLVLEKEALLDTDRQLLSFQTDDLL